MCWMGLALWHKTVICQKLPKDFEQKLLNYQWYITKLRKAGNFVTGQMANAHEMAIYPAMPPNYMLEKKGVKEVLLKTTGCARPRLTIMLAATVDGRKLPNLLILKRKALRKSESFPKDVIDRAQEKRMDDGEADVGVAENTQGRRPRAFLNQPSVLVLDAFKGHLTDSVKNQLRKMNTELVVSPGGMTSVLQPMYVSINKPFKDRFRQQYLTWISDFVS